MLQIAAVALTLATVVGAAFAAGTAAAAATGEALVVVDQSEPHSGQELASELRSFGYTVDESAEVPQDLPSYKSVWTMRVYTSFSTSEQEALESYVRAGGSLLLTGEIKGSFGCCQAADQSDQEIARAVLTNQEVQVGEPAFVGAEGEALQFNPNAKDAITTNPNVLHEFPALSPGGISGIGPMGSPNVLASDGHTATAAVFDESDMVSRRGRLVIYMDSNWLGGTASTKAHLAAVDNIANFLEQEPASESPPPAAEGNVLVVTGESPKNLQAGLRTAAVLRALHYRVTLNVTPAAGTREGPASEGIEKGAHWTMPKLKQYSAVWMLAENSPVVQGADREAIEKYVAAGGRLYLGGSGASGISDVADEDVLRHVLSNERVTLHDAIDEGAMQFAPQALDEIAQEPNLLSEMPIHDTAEISGLASRNVLATAGGTATAAAFDEEDMRRGRGRVVVYPDDWLQT